MYVIKQNGEILHIYVHSLSYCIYAFILYYLYINIPNRWIYYKKLRLIRFKIMHTRMRIWTSAIKNIYIYNVILFLRLQGIAYFDDSSFPSL